MNQKRFVRTYAKRRHGAYPEVDTHILVDLKAKPNERYLVDGSEFTSNLFKARTIMAERLALKDPKVLEANDYSFTPAQGVKRKTQPTDEGKIMRGPQSLETAQAKLHLAKRDLEIIKARTPESDSAEDKAALQAAIGKAEDRVKYQERAVKAAEAGMSVKAFEKHNSKTKAEAIKPTGEVIKNGPNKTTFVAAKSDKPAAPKPATNKDITHKPAPAPMQMPPMMIETGGIKITVHGAEQMDMAIGSLKKHSVI